MAPEVVTGGAYTVSADMYGVSMVLWECLTGKCPFEGLSQIEVCTTNHSYLVLYDSILYCDMR